MALRMGLPRQRKSNFVGNVNAIKFKTVLSFVTKFMFIEEREKKIDVQSFNHRP